MPTPANLFGAIIFGGIGMAAFVYGKKGGHAKAMILGLILMIYPYFVEQTWMLYGIGALLTAGVFVFRD